MHRSNVKNEDPRAPRKRSLHVCKSIQTVNVAHGFVVDMLGIYSLRRNALALLREPTVPIRREALLGVIMGGRSARILVFDVGTVQ